MKRIHVLVPNQMYDAIKEVADKTGLSVSEIIRGILKKELLK